MPFEGRLTHALFKRAEQLKQWDISETNKTPILTPEDKAWKIKFNEGCVFLATCASNDFMEIDRLLKKGADVNTTNIDGLTALHQACIDNNLDMVKFLVRRGCDLNKGDNEGWTPLHAAASCSFVNIARFLIEKGANIAAINNDGDLPIDISESDEMEDLLQEALDEQGINCEEARMIEEKIMLEDALLWTANNRIQDQVHPRTGATALHVAASKGYTKVLSLLVKLGADLNSQDFDGWTPLHAAAHWGQREACELLATNLANMDLGNYNGQTCFDVADPEIVSILEDLKKKQNSMQVNHPEIKEILQRKPRPPLKRKTSVTRMSGIDKSNMVCKDLSAERAAIAANIPVLEEDTDEEPEKKALYDFEEEQENINPMEEDLDKVKVNGTVINEKHIDEKKEIEVPISPIEVIRNPQLYVREDSSETQRKANARRARETRRSTQGVSSEDVKTAEQLMQKPASQVENKEASMEEPIMKDITNEPTDLKDERESVTKMFNTHEADDEEELNDEREELENENEAPESPAISLPLRTRKLVRQESKESEGMIRQRRPKRRSSGVVYLDLEELGIKINEEGPEEEEPLNTVSEQIHEVNHHDLEKNSSHTNHKEQQHSKDLDNHEIPVLNSANVKKESEVEPVEVPEIKTEKIVKEESKSKADSEEGISDRYRGNRYGSSSHLSDVSSDGSSYGRISRSGSIGSLDNVDFKRLYEEEREENRKLKQKLENSEDELEKTKKQLIKLQQNNKNAQNEKERKERRALERQVSEMEEEVKLIEKMRSENQRLKDENAALVRVISKLSK